MSCKLLFLLLSKILSVQLIRRTIHCALAQAFIFVPRSDQPLAKKKAFHFQLLEIYPFIMAQSHRGVGSVLPQAMQAGFNPVTPDASRPPFNFQRDTPMQNSCSVPSRR